jgi:hypothetical protein
LPPAVKPQHDAKPAASRFKEDHLKSHEITNLITTQAWELSFEATTSLRKMRRSPSIIAACFSQAELWP